jgi:hypothetical protein
VPSDQIRSAPAMSAALVGNSATTNMCWYARLFSMKETCSSLLTSMSSPVTPNNSDLVVLTSVCNMPGRSVDMLDPVSRIKLCGLPSMCTKILGVP